MTLRSLFALYASKFSSFVIKTLTSGSGSTWPGHIALQIDDTFVENIISTSKIKVILVVGTNGKTTTSSLIAHILKREGKKVLQNSEGANLLNGIASTLVKNSSVSGKLDYDLAIFEVDENNLPIVAQHTSPSLIVALNLFRDQLDRYGEVNTIAKKWKNELEKLNAPTTLVLNTDDPLVRYLGHKTHHNTKYFDVSGHNYKKGGLSHDVDSTFCPVSGDELTFSKITFSHLGKFECKKCGYTNAKATSIDVKNPPLKGLYNLYNIQAALVASSVLLDEDAKKLVPSLKGFKPSFGRGETIEYEERNFEMLLSKNPAGFNQSLSVFIQDKKSTHVILSLNDRVPDGRDISWIWDVDFEMLDERVNNIYLAGDRAWDLAIRMQYADTYKKSNIKNKKYNSKIRVYEKTEGAIEESVRNTKKGETIYVLPTYSAMLEMRKVLVGRKLL